VAEHDFARRLIYAAKRDADLPRGYGNDLLQIHDRHPFAESPQEIEEDAALVRDANFRIAVAEDGVHVYNSRIHAQGRDALSFFPKLGVEQDGAHAFYLGTELMKAEIAASLGKRYAQDEPLDWGVAADAPADDKTRLKAAGHTLVAKKNREAS
jgi:hypothetical protein